MSSNRTPPRLIPGFICVGWIKSAHGIRGELFLKLKSGQAEWRQNVSSVMLLSPGQTQPMDFDVVELKPHKDGLIARLKQVSDRNRAEELAKSAVYVRESHFEAAPGEPIFLRQILNFTLVDESMGVVGVIEGFGSNGPQDLLRVRLGRGGESLVPFVDAFIRHIDFDKREVRMDLPPGLINLED